MSVLGESSLTTHRPRPMATQHTQTDNRDPVSGKRNKSPLSSGFCATGNPALQAWPHHSAAGCAGGGGGAGAAAGGGGGPASDEDLELLELLELLEPADLRRRCLRLLNLTEER